MRIFNKIVARLCGLPIDLYLSRHGESSRNVGLADTTTKLFFDTHEQLEEWGKHPDHEVPLTKKGVEQAKQKGSRFVEQRLRQGARCPDVIIHSGYERAWHTARVFAGQIMLAGYPDIPLVEDFSIREREAGITHVLLAHEVKDHFAWNDRYWKCVGGIHGRPLGGESLLDLREGRVGNFLSNGLRPYRGKVVVAVCHGRIMQAAHMHLLRMTLQQMEEYYREPHPKNCEIRQYSFNWRIRKLEYVGVV